MADLHMIKQSDLFNFSVKNRKLISDLERMVNVEYEGIFTFNFDNYLVKNNGNLETNSWFLVDNGEIIAFARSYVRYTDILFRKCKVEKKMYLHISDVIVSPKHRRKGICSMIMNRIIKRNNGKMNIVLRVEKKNKGAIKCYQGLGFDFIDSCEDSDIFYMERRYIHQKCRG